MCLTTTIQTGLDSYISSTSPTTNYTADLHFDADNVIGLRRTVFEFDVSSLTNANAISSAKVTLWLDTASTIDGAVALCRLTQPAWNHAQVTWNSYSTGHAWSSAGGDFTSTHKATTAVVSADTTAEFDVLDLVKDAIEDQDGRLILLFKVDDEGGATARVAARSFEYGTPSQRPLLVIQSVANLPASLDTDFAFDFAADTGFEYDSDLSELADGVLRLKDGIEDSDTILTPSIDISSYTPTLNRVFACGSEEVGYEHRFLVSFDDGDRYFTFTDSGWSLCDLTDISRRGMTRSQLGNVRYWGAVGQYESISFAIYINRESGGGDGSLNFIALCYGSVIPVFHSVDDEPDELTLIPVLPYRITTKQKVTVTRTEDGSMLSIPLGPMRRVLDIEFKEGEEGRDDVVEFLLAHTDKHFLWTPLAYDDPVRWISREPTVESIGFRIYSVRTTFIEMFAHENAAEEEAA